MTIDWPLAKRLVFGLLLMTSAVRLFPTSAPFGAQLRLMGELLTMFLTLWAPGYALLSLRRRHALSEADSQLLAVPLTVALYGAMFVLLHSCSAPIPLYVFVYLGGLVAACVSLGRRLRAGNRIDLPRAYAVAFLLATVAGCFICTHLDDSPWKAMTWQTPATRATHSLDVDNNLPWNTAQVFIDGGEPWAWKDGYWNWSMGDRPALFAALTAVYAKSFLAYRKFRFFDYTLLGIVLNVMYVVPCAHLARQVIRNERLALWTVLSVALMPYFFVNVYYTWPKLFGTLFTMTALAFFLKRSREDAWAWPKPRAAAVLGGLLSLGAQCHGGAALSAPFVVLTVALFAAKPSPRQLVTAGGALMGSFVLIMLPWRAYISAHPDTQTNNLIYHYRPFLDRPGNAMPWSQWWTEYPLDKQLALRWGNVLKVFDSSEFIATLEAYVRGPLQPFYAQRWIKEYYHPVSQVDELRIMLAALAAAFALLFFALRRWPGSVDRADTQCAVNMPVVATLILLSFLSYLTNAFIKWQEIVPHALPIAEIACMCLSLALLIAGVSRVLVYLLLWSVLARFAYFVVFNTASPQMFGTYGSCALTSFGLLLWTISSKEPQSGRTTSQRAEAELTG